MNNKILIIEDDASVRNVLNTILKKQGFNVFVAENGKEGAEIFAENSPDLVVTDIIMPEQDGIGFIMNAKQKQPDLKIIAISGGGRITASDHLKVAKGLGANVTLTKPFDPKELIDEIKKLLV